MSLCQVLLIALAIDGVLGAIKEHQLPVELVECLKMADRCSSSVNITDESTYNLCEEMFDENRNTGYKINKAHLDHFKEILQNLKHEIEGTTRRKRNAGCPNRVRKEVRQLTAIEWSRFTNATNILKQQGVYDSLAAIHRGFPRLSMAHGGPNFLGWHRVYLLVFEDLLREIEPCVTIPYWDSSLDYDMDNPTESVLWTETFFGNGDGQVDIGPFGGWITGQGQLLARNIGSSGSLITKQNVRRVLRYYNNINSDITDLFGRPADSIELYHNGPHVWVDGHMSGLNTASEDPVFFMHHAFIDCWWQRFREKIWRNWGVNSTFDYPDVDGLHNGDNPMNPWNDTTNSEGYSDYWNSLYKCKSPPYCTKKWRNACRSEYLECRDFNKRPKARCVSLSGAQARFAVSESVMFDKTEDTIMEMPPSLESTKLRPLLDPGPTFLAFFVDNRTRGDPLQRRATYLHKHRSKRETTITSLLTPDTVPPSCEVLNDVSNLHFSIAYLDPEKLGEVDKNDEFVYIPIRLVGEAGGIGTYMALIYGIDGIARYRVPLSTVTAQNSTMAIVPMPNPSIVSAEYVLTVIESSGEMCSPECLEESYSPCSGAVILDTDSPHMYSVSYEYLLNEVENYSSSQNGVEQKLVFLQFICQ